MECKRGKGRFQWNTGGWFGAQVGSTCWMLACGLSVLRDSLPVAALFLGLFVLANLIGTVLWAKRDKSDPYQAIQILLVILFVFTVTAMVSADYVGILGKLDPRCENPRLLYMLLLLFPGLMVLFHFQNKAGAPDTKS